MTREDARGDRKITRTTAKPPEDEPEDALIRRCQAGDSQAFGRLVKKYAGAAVGAATLLLGNRQDALEVSQDAFVRAWRRIKRFEPGRPFYPWYATVLRHMCIDRLRKRKITRDLQPDDARAQPDSDPVLQAERKELRDRVRKAVQELPLKHREVIVMQHFQDMSYRQMAEALDVPEGTVMSRLYYARRALRQKLAEENNEL